MTINNHQEKILKAARREKKKRPKMAVHGRSFKREIIKLGERRSPVEPLRDSMGKK